MVHTGYADGVPFVCSICGSYPAADVNLRQHHGAVVWMERIKLNGPFCRSCGLSEFRDMTSATLFRGWWGVFSMFVAPVTLLANLNAYRKIRKLPEPVPGSPRSPLRVGKPVHKRFAIAMLVVPLLLVSALVYAATRDDGDDMRFAERGDCVVNSGTENDPEMRFVACDSTEPGVFRVVGRLDGATSDAGCPNESTAAFTYRNDRNDDKYVLCLVAVDSAR
ncbi:LppU/SCO3897 family protein [Yinghuangia seranimata]|uniref:LppU/SCO3897 family protein n=1 Tax=Yinghuangia seranimata TaxID=408067 RepID=UPI00248BE71B|nr:hypothetical protein [Yinghuangia seranimata]MDI2126783.1 hypothetical protein [Yinghuangia seranimata]